MKLWQYSRLLHQNQSFFDYLNWRLVREACALSLHEVTWLGVKNLKVKYLSLIADSAPNNDPELKYGDVYFFVSACT
ncbi:hypothetical protein V6Z12_D05G176700 [Gossypium hirsutum]